MAVLTPVPVCLQQYDYADKSWCSCSTNVSCKHRGDRLQCKCGEEWQVYEWNWENDSSATNVELSNNNRDVLFHPVYSSGTAAVRGQQPLKQNMHYYWEIKMLTNLYGTDIMVGVGTSKVVLSDWRLRFCSMLGYDCESWGYSYTGKIQHAKLSCNYGSRFSLGSLIGVHVDMCAGTLEYYLNRKPLGIAFRGLKHYELYPMVSSTAAESAMRITCALSEVPTLQLECLKLIINNHKLLKQYWNIPGLARMVGKKYFWLVPQLPTEKPLLELEDEVVLPLSALNRNFARCKRFCTGLEYLSDPRADPDHISYRQYLCTKEKYERNIVQSCRQQSAVVVGKVAYDCNSNINLKSADESEHSDSSKPECSSPRQQIVLFKDALDQSHHSDSCINELYGNESEGSDFD